MDIKERIGKAIGMVEKTKRSTAAKLSTAIATACSAVGIGYCNSGITAPLNRFLDASFSVTTFAGILLAGAGAATLIKTIVSISGGNEQAQPGAIGKGVGMLVGGIALALLKTFLGYLGIATSV